MIAPVIAPVISPVISPVIVVGALVTLGSNAIEEKVEEVSSEPPLLDSPE